ncbi:MAG: ArsA-related P-loop ATPase, partial [Actinomycetes bacterium]
DRMAPVQRQVARSLRPILGRVLDPAGAALPDPRVLDAVQRLHHELAEVHEVLTAPQTSVRLVLTPEAVVVAEARRTLTTLALYGYRVDGVVANRIFPDDGADEWRNAWVSAQGAMLSDVESSFAPLPLYRSKYQATEPIGHDALLSLAEQMYGDADPFEVPPDRDVMSVERVGSGFVLHLSLPLAERRDLDLARVGDDLVVTFGAYRRIIALPGALRRCAVTSATLDGGRLAVDFTPDRAVWPSA